MREVYIPAWKRNLTVGSFAEINSFTGDIAEGGMLEVVLPSKDTGENFVARVILDKVDGDVIKLSDINLIRTQVSKEEEIFVLPTPKNYPAKP
jgi:hypothetical protein